MVYFFILVFLAFSLYNLRGIREMILRIYFNPICNLILILAGLLYIYMAYKLDGSLAGYILGLSGFFYLNTNTFCQGIARNGIFVLMGSSIIRKLNPKDVKDIKIDEKNNTISIYADSTIYKQKYKKEDFPKVLKIIGNFK
ncbi:hypothetical protein [uncultured Anaerococcus sp.]|uniref:hypothetical protein n=1 Tax=uncultured Anaerococcus sp. TaxID=293428 RepID=UPI00288B1AA1|nr:hypothetical protein [uncultured Anaerococcus sp.]